jgi:hypothetical protein
MPTEKRTTITAARTRKSPHNLIELDVETPIPLEYKSLMFRSPTGTPYIPFPNPANDFPQFLTECKLLSPTTLACVNSKTQYCLGKGWYLTDNAQVPDLEKWALCVNKKQQSLNDIIKVIFGNLFTIGNAYVEVIRGAIGKKKFVQVYVKNYMDCRLKRPDDNADEDVCTAVVVSKIFRQQGFNAQKDIMGVELPLWSNNPLDSSWVGPDTVSSDGFEHTMLHLKTEADGFDYYGLPTNISSLPQQILEYKAARYNLDNFENNLALGGLILLKGNVTEQEARKLGREIIYQHTGDGKRGRYAILSSESGCVSGADVVPFTKQMEGDYIAFDKRIEDKLLTANQWHGILIGRFAEAGLGNGGTNYVRSIFDIANNSVVIPMQHFLLEKFIRPLLHIHDEWVGTDWSKARIALKPVTPVTFLGDVDINAVMTVNEGREIIGRPALQGAEGNHIIHPEGNKNPTTHVSPQSA